MLGYYANLAELAQYIREVSQKIMGGGDKYPGVGICLQKGKITVSDWSSPSGAKQIAYTDLIGQPTWIRPAEISIKTVMRGDILVDDQITLPPTRIINTGAAYSGLSGPLGKPYVPGHVHGPGRQASWELPPTGRCFLGDRDRGGERQHLTKLLRIGWNQPATFYSAARLAKACQRCDTAYRDGPAQEVQVL